MDRCTSHALSRRASSRGAEPRIAERPPPRAGGAVAAGAAALLVALADGAMTAMSSIPPFVRDVTRRAKTDELERQWERMFLHTKRGITVTEPATRVMQSVKSPPSPRCTAVASRTSQASRSRASSPGSWRSAFPRSRSTPRRSATSSTRPTTSSSTGRSSPSGPRSWRHATARARSSTGSHGTRTSPRSDGSTTRAARPRSAFGGRSRTPGRACPDRWAGGAGRPLPRRQPRPLRADRLHAVRAPPDGAQRPHPPRRSRGRRRGHPPAHERRGLAPRGRDPRPRRGGRGRVDLVVDIARPGRGRRAALPRRPPRGPHRAQALRGPAPVSRRPRLPDRSVQPAPLRVGARTRAVGGPPPRHRGPRARARPRQLQVHQRRARPLRRRRADRLRRACDEGAPARERHPRPSRGRRVRRDPPARRRERRPRGRRHPARHDPRRRLDLHRPGLPAHVGERRIAIFFDATDRASAEELLVEADIALYDAKEAGRNRFAVYDPQVGRHERMATRLTWIERISVALRENRFVLHAQPIVPLQADAGPARHELLVRMRGQDGDPILPGTFLYIAERADLVQEIDRWVVRRAIRLLAEQQHAGNDVSFEVNLSSKSITDPDMPELVPASSPPPAPTPGG